MKIEGDPLKEEEKEEEAVFIRESITKGTRLLHLLVNQSQRKIRLTRRRRKKRRKNQEKVVFTRRMRRLCLSGGGGGGGCLD